MTQTATLTPIYSRLVNRVDTYLTAPNGQWITSHNPLTKDTLLEALEGTLPLGLMAVSGAGTSRWIAIDVDQEEQMEALDRLAQELEATNATLYELSRRGAHLFIFINPAPWEDARAYGQHLAEKAGLKGVEVFPKHGGLNAIRMPGTTHPKTGERYPIISPSTGQILDLTEVLEGVTPIPCPAQAIRDIQPTVPHQGDFGELIEALAPITWLKVYRPGRAIALCPWHDDHSPSLLIKGGRFHCQRPDCVWGDRQDLMAWIHHGKRPPNH